VQKELENLLCRETSGVAVTHISILLIVNKIKAIVGNGGRDASGTALIEQVAR